MSVLRALTVLLLSTASVVAQDPPRATGTITGRVIDALGDGLAAVQVEAVDGDSVVARGLSDGDGMFVLGRVPIPEGWATVRATAAGRTVETSYVRLRAGQPAADTELRLWDAGTIRARVVDADGEPIEGAHVSVGYDRSRLFAFDPAAQGLTDEDGTLELPNVPLGFLDVRAWKDGFALQTDQLWLRDESDVVLSLQRDGGVAIEVRIEDLPEGREASVSLIPYENGSAKTLPRALVRGTATDGRWSLTGMPDLEFRVRARAEGFTFSPSQARLEAGGGDRAVTFRATETSQVRVKGLLRDTAGRPLPGETIHCRHWSSSTRGTAVTDENGRFDVTSPVPVGERAILQLADSAFVLAQPKAKELLGSWDARFRVYHEFVVDPAVSMEVVAAPGATVRGRVVDDDGQPVRGLRLELQAAEPNRSPIWMAFAHATTGRDGNFTFAGLSPPSGELRVSPGEIGTDATEAFTLQAGSTKAGLELVVEKAGIVEGVARDANGEPVPGARVWLRNYDVVTGMQTDGSVFEVLADREGRFRHIGVEPGGHMLQLLLEGDHGDAARSDIFEVEAGARLSIDLQDGR